MNELILSFLYSSITGKYHAKHRYVALCKSFYQNFYISTLFQLSNITITWL